MKTYLWIEDRKEKSGYIFWQMFMGQLCPEIAVESKNNSELVKAVRALEDSENRYVVVFDNSFDNLQVAMEQKLLRKYAKAKNNIFLMDVICFEYILLEFKDLVEWIYASDDEILISPGLIPRSSAAQQTNDERSESRADTSQLCCEEFH